MRKGRRWPRRGVAAATELTASAAVMVPAAAQGDSGWSTFDGDGQHTRQAEGLGPVEPVVDWVWNDSTYEADGAIGRTDTNIPGVVDHQGRLLFKSRNTRYDDEKPHRKDLLALDPETGAAETVLPDVGNDYCVPAVAPDGTIWTFQRRTPRTNHQHDWADHSAAALVSIDPDTLEILSHYSGPGGDVAGVYGCTGLEVHAFDNAEDVVVHAADIQPDLMVLDIMMPQRDGLSALQVLKEDDRTRDIPVVLLTAKATDAEVWEGWEAGADFYITKPFDVDELLHFIQYLSMQTAPPVATTR